MGLLTNNEVSRREVIGLSLAGAGLLLSTSVLKTPEPAFAATVGQVDQANKTSGLLDLSSFSEDQRAAFLQKIAEAEIQEIISNARKESSALNYRSARDRFIWKYGKVTNFSTGYRVLPGQPKNGVSFNTSGAVYCTVTGGTSVSVNVGFSHPLGYVNLSVPFGKYKGETSVVGETVNIPGGKVRYKVWLNVDFETLPYIIYHEDVKGKRTLYRKWHTTPVRIGYDFEARKV
jgi:hypothetical protein